MQEPWWGFMEPHEQPAEIDWSWLLNESAIDSGLIGTFETIGNTQ